MAEKPRMPPDFPTPLNEEERLRELYDLDLIGTGRNEQIDRICVLARDLFKVPIALVNIIDRDRLICLSSCGLDIVEIPRGDALCNTVILSDCPMVVHDAASDPRFRDNIFVCGPPQIRFYAGAPLRLRAGINIGSLCVIDSQPRSFDSEEQAHLNALADMVVTELRGQRAEREIAASKTRMEQTARLARIGGWELSLPSHKLYWEDALYRIYGIPLGTPPDHELIVSRYDPPARDQSRRRLTALFTTGAPYDVELRGTRPNGEVFWIRAMAEPEIVNGRIARVIGAVQDITERKRAEERIHELAYRDPLTGLPNRSWFMGNLDGLVAAGKRSGGSFALIKFDIDHFREVNDALGHQKADTLLTSIANGLAKRFGDLGPVARIGGDEFAAALRQRNGGALQLAAQVAQDFIDHAKRTYRQADALPLSMSAGVALFPVHGRDTETIMKNAKLALFSAKAQRRGSVVAFDPVMRHAIDRTNELVRRVSAGIAKHEFALFYQPIVSLRDNRVTGFEALLRWHDPARGLLTPASFMDAFEHPDLAADLGERAFDLAIAQMRAWLDAGVDFGNIAVNVSTAQFRVGDLAETVLDKLARAGVPPDRLTLEVTEGVYMAWGAETVVQAVCKLHEAGVGIALDDFGTGYASLTHLRQFPIDKLKIDKSFVQSPDSLAIVDAVINMGLSLGMQVVAEGVEQPEQLKLLRMKGCDFVQGFIFAEPLPADQVPGFLVEFHGRTPARKTSRR